MEVQDLNRQSLEEDISHASNFRSSMRCETSRIEDITFQVNLRPEQAP